MDPDLSWYKQELCKAVEIAKRLNGNEDFEVANAIAKVVSDAAYSLARKIQRDNETDG